MIAVWELDSETGKPSAYFGLFETDEELEKAILPSLQNGTKFFFGDVVPFTTNYIPPKVEINRTKVV